MANGSWRRKSVVVGSETQRLASHFLLLGPGLLTFSMERIRRELETWYIDGSITMRLCQWRDDGSGDDVYDFGGGWRWW